MNYREMLCEYQASWPQPFPKRVSEMLEGLIMWWFCVCLRAHHCVTRTRATWGFFFEKVETTKKALEHRVRQCSRNVFFHFNPLP